MALTVTAEPPVFLYVTVAFSVWPGFTVVLSRVSGLTMLSAPGDGGAAAVIVTSADAERDPSDAVSRSTYDPEVEKLAVVLRAPTLPKLTVPGPLTFDHVVVNVLPEGRPSSEAVPFNVAELGSVIV